MAKDPVLEPFEVKGLRLKNRILSTAHAPSYVDNGKPQLRYRLYHEEKAKGGLAMTMFGGSTTTAPDSPSAFGQINAASDAVVPYFQELADTVHRHDCAIMCQITAALEVGGTNFPNYLRDLYQLGVRLTPDLELTAVRREGNRLIATFWNEYADSEVERAADFVVVEHGTLPADELYHGLKAGSPNGGAVDLEALTRGELVVPETNPEGSYQLFRVEDAVSSRNLHAAIYDA